MFAIVMFISSHSCVSSALLYFTSSDCLGKFAVCGSNVCIPMYLLSASVSAYPCILSGRFRATFSSWPSEMS